MIEYNKHFPFIFQNEISGSYYVEVKEEEK